MASRWCVPGWWIWSRELAAIPGIEDISLSTNGLLLAELAEPLARAGLRRVNVSLDTLRAERFEELALRPGLDRVLAGIDAALAAGLTPLKLNCVVMRGHNDDEIPAFAALTKDRPIAVRFIELMPVEKNVALQGDAYLSSDEVLECVRSVEELARSRDRKAMARPAIMPSRAPPARSV